VGVILFVCVVVVLIGVVCSLLTVVLVLGCICFLVSEDWCCSWFGVLVCCFVFVSFEERFGFFG